jgi:hypothetical protein
MLVTTRWVLLVTALAEVSRQAAAEGQVLTREVPGCRAHAAVERIVTSVAAVASIDTYLGHPYMWENFILVTSWVPFIAIYGFLAVLPRFRQLTHAGPRLPRFRNATKNVRLRTKNGKDTDNFLVTVWRTG